MSKNSWDLEPGCIHCMQLGHRCSEHSDISHDVQSFISQLEAENGKLRAQLEAGRELAEAVDKHLSAPPWDSDRFGILSALAKWKEAGR
jgi:hypothetical protein